MEFSASSSNLCGWLQVHADVAPYGHDEELESRHLRLLAVGAINPFKSKAILLNCFERGQSATID